MKTPLELFDIFNKSDKILISLIKFRTSEVFAFLTRDVFLTRNVFLTRDVFLSRDTFLSREAFL